MHLLDFSDSFEYLCYGSTAITAITVREPTLVVRIWRRRPTDVGDPRAVRVKKGVNKHLREELMTESRVIFISNNQNL